jgi:hypothetical protein
MTRTYEHFHLYFPSQLDEYNRYNNDNSLKIKRESFSYNMAINSFHQVISSLNKQ